IGRTYLERGRPVRVLARWAPPAPTSEPAWLSWERPPRPVAPRNVLIERGDGTRVVRPFRGLRRAGGGS
ncbi:MAG TPA: hypothetical protein VHH34_21195, partial [Pseudonocardiaceae bacterium]|nr:hypothetical protein [Pseudonocardiaceae bacterium]